MTYPQVSRAPNPKQRTIMCPLCGNGISLEPGAINLCREKTCAMWRVKLDDATMREWGEAQLACDKKAAPPHREV